MEIKTSQNQDGEEREQKGKRGAESNIHRVQVRSGMGRGDNGGKRREQKRWKVREESESG